MARNGTVGWSSLLATPVTHADGRVEVPIHYEPSTVDWNALQDVYGWAALQHQSWIRGTFRVRGHTRKCVLMWLGGAVEYIIDDDRSFGGDLFSFKRAPVVLHLEPGQHTLCIRLVRDVRALGATGAMPSVDVALVFQPVEEKQLLINDGAIIVPDVAHGKLAGAYASVPITNCCEDEITVTNVMSASVGLHQALGESSG